MVSFCCLIVAFSVLQIRMSSTVTTLKKKLKECYNSTKKRQHYFDILKAFFVRHSSEYKTSVVTERLTKIYTQVQLHVIG